MCLLGDSIARTGYIRGTCFFNNDVIWAPWTKETLRMLHSVANCDGWAEKTFLRLCQKEASCSRWGFRVFVSSGYRPHQLVCPLWLLGLCRPLVWLNFRRLASCSLAASPGGSSVLRFLIPEDSHNPLALAGVLPLRGVRCSHFWHRLAREGLAGDSSWLGTCHMGRVALPCHSLLFSFIATSNMQIG